MTVTTTTTTSAASSVAAPQNQRKALWILDGGTGREIDRLGGPFRQPEWSALALYQDPDLVRRIHESFLHAGSNAITTNTYAIVPFHLGRERYNKDAKRLLNLAVDLAVEAKGGDESVQLLGSIPPISGSYQPGSFDEAIAGPIIHDFLEAFRGRVDAIILETMGSAEEAAFALTQIAQSGIGCPTFLSFHVQGTSDGLAPRLLTGDTLTEAMQFLSEKGLLQAERVPVVLVNCCDIYIIQDALEELHSVLGQDFRIGAYPNAFSEASPSVAANQKARLVNTALSPSVLHDLAESWVDQAGASVIGGCCGIGPDHIRALASLKVSAFDANNGIPPLSAEPTADLPIAAFATSTKSKHLVPPPSSCAITAAMVCGIQGCAGCGVQIGFGQNHENLCHVIDGDKNPACVPKGTVSSSS